MNKLQHKQDIEIKQYIIDCIDPEAYEVKAETEKEKLQFLYDTFMGEYSYMIDRVGPQRAFMEWCQGLPSCFNIEFENYRILELARNIGTLPKDATPGRENRILNNYWNYIANKTFQLFRKHKIV